MSNLVTAWDFLDNDRVAISYSNGKTVILGVYHHNEKDRTILCDDFETYIKY